MIVPLSPIAIIPNIPRPKHTIQQPPRHPIGTVLTGRGAASEERTGQGPSILRDFDDAPPLTLGTDMMPEEGRPSRRIIRYAVEEMRGIFVEAIVDDNRFILFLSIIHCTIQHSIDVDVNMT